MADQGVKYVVTINGQQGIATLNSLEASASRTEASIASLNSAGAALGIGFGLHELVAFGKDAVQGAADYEMAMLRIRNVSKNAFEGQENIRFINSEVDKLKIPLQEAADAYGNFLVKIANSGLAGDQVRKLHDEILSIAKVTGAPQGKMDAAVLDIGKMLAEGVLEARTLRQLERVFPQITPYIAEKLGVTLQQLSKMESSGKLTKAAIDSRVLLSAIDSYYDSIKGKIPDSIKTIQSQINDFSNDWLTFKNDLVFDNLPELKSLFSTLKEGIAFLKENEGNIITVSKALFTLGEIWVAYKLAMAGTAAIQKGIASMMGNETTAIAAQETATASLNTQVELLNTNLELLIANQTAAAGVANLMTDAEIAGFAGALSYSSKRLPIKGVANMAAEDAAVASAGWMAATATSVINGALLVYIAGSAIDFLSPQGKSPNGDPLGFFHPINMIKEQIRVGLDDMKHEGAGEMQTGGDWNHKEWSNFNKGSYTRDAENYKGFPFEKFPFYGAPAGYMGAMPKWMKEGNSPKISSPVDKITGNHAITYTTNISKIIGMEVGTQNNIEGKIDQGKLKEILADIFSSINNDRQLTGGN